MDCSKYIEWLKSDEGHKSITDFFDKVAKEESIKAKQLERFHKFGNFSDFVEKVIVKYTSEEYTERWYKRGFEPQESLYWFLYQYAEKYGRKCNKTEHKKYGNMFTSGLFFCDGYFLNRMDGQGSVIKITKLKKNGKNITNN